MVFALLSAIGNAVNVLGSKLVFKEKDVDFRNFLSVTIFFIFFFANIYYFIFRPGFPVWELKTIILFAIMSVLAFGFNALYFYALSRDEVCNIEQIDMTRPLFTVLLATIIFRSERNIPIAVLTIIAALALVFSRLEKHHLKLNKASLAMFGYVFLVGIETQIVKLLLEVFHPVSFYVVRTGVLAVLFYFFLRPNLKNLNKKNYSHFFMMAFIVSAEYITRFFAIQNVGIVKTSLLFLLAPVIVLIFSKIFLKENLTLKKAIADLIIVFCVGLGIII